MTYHVTGVEESRNLEQKINFGYIQNDDSEINFRPVKVDILETMLWIFEVYKTHEMMKVLFLDNLIWQLSLPTFRLDALVLLRDE